MNQRREPRVVADQAVVVTVFGDPETQQKARIRNISGRGLSIETTEAVPPGIAIKIELEDAILLGEVVYCKAGDGSFLLGVELDQVLCGLTELSKKLQEFAADEPNALDAPRSRLDDRRQSRQSR
jgi:hypothetical protein